MSGFVVMARDATEHPLLKDGERFRAWFWMVARACWKPTKFDVHGSVVTLERGQFCCSVREMAEAWGWSKSAVDRFVQRLIDEDMVISTRAKTGTGGGTAGGTARSIITICNYAKYQDIPKEGGTATEPQTGTAAGQQRDIKEQGNHSDVLEPDGSTTSQRPKGLRACRIPPDWKPSALPPNVAELVAQWPPGRELRELDGFRDYWTARQRDAARIDWDKVWHNRIRDIHDRVMRTVANDRAPHQSQAYRGNGVASALDRRIGSVEPPSETERRPTGLGGDDSALPLARIAVLR